MQQKEFSAHMTCVKRLSRPKVEEASTTKSVRKQQGVKDIKNFLMEHSPAIHAVK